MTPRVFDGLKLRGYDTAVVWDHTDPRLNGHEALEGYDEIAVAAWSYGVPSASRFIASHSELPFTARIAINGTQHPVDARRGIAPEIFRATLAGLSERGIHKFNLRMCGGAAALATVAPRLGGRDISSLRAELEAIGDRTPAVISWDKAIVSVDDAIIPPAAQKEAWASEAAETVVIPGPHFPDFEDILTAHLTDKSLVARRFGRAGSTYDRHAILQHLITDTLLAMIPPHLSRGADIIEIGAGTGRATRRLAGMAPRSMHVWDLHITPGVATIAGITPRETDAETAILTTPAESADLIFSASTVQWFNSLPSFLSRAAGVLRPGGAIVLSTFAPETMQEVHRAAGTTSRFPTPEAISRMIPPGMSVTVMRTDIHTMRFGSPMDVMRHIRATGVNSLSATAGPAEARRVIDNYGDPLITYAPIYIVLEKK